LRAALAAPRVDLPGTCGSTADDLRQPFEGPLRNDTLTQGARREMSAERTGGEERLAQVRSEHPAPPTRTAREPVRPGVEGQRGGQLGRPGRAHLAPRPARPGGIERWPGG